MFARSKCLFLVVLLLLAALPDKVLFADNPGKTTNKEHAKGWQPKWEVGDWWIIEIKYDLSKYSPIAMESKPNIISTRYKFIVAKEVYFESEINYLIEIRCTDNTPSDLNPPNIDLYVTKNNMQIRKMIFYKASEDEIIVEKNNPGYAIRRDIFNIYILPRFPLTVTSKIQSGVKYKFMTVKYSAVSQKGEKKKKKDSYLYSKVNIVDKDSLKFINVKDEYLSSNIYRVWFGDDYKQYWVEKVPWFVYFKDGGITGYLVEYGKKIRQ
ncbi:MAG: hypothetical protein Q7W05_03495 [Deltaproteobacteria bacterium]|nr:hypothetical protein [Deltaproteobacteria bacterium]